jgi:hypothetical protein
VRDAFTHAHGDSNGNGYRHSNCGDFGDAYSNGNSNSNAHAGANAEADADAEAAADATASPVGCSATWKR